MSECENCEQLDYAAIIGDAVRFERERIIKLLKEELGEHDSNNDCWIPLVRAIYVIEGENK